MPKDYPRSYRVADQIQRELSDLIRFEVKDPRVPAMVTVAAVEVSNDLGHARVYVSMYGHEDREGAVAALNKAAGFLRSRLAHRIRLRSVPELRFHYDDVQEQGAQLSQLIDDAVQSNTTQDQSEGDNLSDQGQRHG